MRDMGSLREAQRSASLPNKVVVEENLGGTEDNDTIRSLTLFRATSIYGETGRLGITFYRDCTSTSVYKSTMIRSGKCH